jgi:hypothetical protein
VKTGLIFPAKFRQNRLETAQAGFQVFDNFFSQVMEKQRLFLDGVADVGAVNDAGSDP